MGSGLLGDGVVVQIGIIVRNIEKSAEEFAALLGVPAPQWMLTDALDKAKTLFRGKPSAARAKLAFIKSGQLDIELIEPDAGPSTWREFLDERGEGIHHIAFLIKGMEANVSQLEKRGFPLLQKGEYTGGRYAYVDAASSLKTIVELLEND
jgi:methylmalonyl-CoA/ethylmalonyl-CoA epimerase